MLDTRSSISNLLRGALLATAIFSLSLFPNSAEAEQSLACQIALSQAAEAAAEVAAYCSGNLNTLALCLLASGELSVANAAAAVACEHEASAEAAAAEVSTTVDDLF